MVPRARLTRGLNSPQNLKPRPNAGAFSVLTGRGRACLLPPMSPEPASPQIRYRLAHREDAAAIARFAANTFIATFAHLYPPEDLAAYLAAKYGPDIQRAEIEEPGVIYWLAEQDGEIVGYAMAGPVDMDTPHEDADRELYRFYVRADMKGAGIADALLGLVLDWARAQGAPALWLSVWENNERAQRFYARYGFEHRGEHKFMVGRIADRDFIWRLALE